MRIEIETAQLMLYPNPATGSFFVEADKAIQKVELIILGGQIITSRIPNTSKLEIKVDGLSKGIYFCRIVFADGVVTKKLVLN